jgi:hypothetical protein
MFGIDMKQFVSASVEFKDVLLRHWAVAIIGTITLYMLKNKYGSGLNGILGPFLAGMHSSLITDYQVSPNFTNST